MALSASSSLATPARNTPTMDDYRNLRELLEQALKREAEALRKVKHLHDLLAERSASGGEGKSCHVEIINSSGFCVCV